MARWSWIAAACRGTSHERSATRLQDARSCFVTTGGRSSVFVATVADGAGSAEFGGEGASLVCRSLATAIRKHFRTASILPSDEQLSSWVDAARDRIFAVAARRGKVPRDYASTLICTVTDGWELLVAHIGDGCVVVKDGITQQWKAPSWPDHGEYASTTRFVTDEPAAKLRIARQTGQFDAVVVFSDGLERLSLDFKTCQPFDRFFDVICRPLYSTPAAGRDSALSGQLKAYLNSEAINSRTDDDKTLVIAVAK